MTLSETTTITADKVKLYVVLSIGQATDTSFSIIASPIAAFLRESNAKMTAQAEQEMGEVRNCRIQLTAISSSNIAAGLLLDSARDRLLASDYTVGVYGSPLGTYDAARKLHGRLQQFGIWFQQ